MGRYNKRTRYDSDDETTWAVDLLDWLYNWVGLLDFVSENWLCALGVLLLFFVAYFWGFFYGSVTCYGTQEYPRALEVSLLY